jgi:hypothetical protein
MTYTTKMSLAIAAIGTLTFVYSSNCEAKIPTFPPYYSCGDIAGAGYNACVKENPAAQEACQVGRDAITNLCEDKK